MIQDFLLFDDVHVIQKHIVEKTFLWKFTLTMFPLRVIH